MKFSGKIWVFGDDINTDLIFPGRYTYELMSDEDMGKYALEDADSEFNRKAVAGDIIVAGKNWGCGSSREQAVKSLKARGVAAIVAKSFSRIFYRNALNEGLLTITSADAIKYAKEGSSLTIDMDAHAIEIAGEHLEFPPYPEYLTKLISCGGLIPYTKQILSEQKKKA